MDCTKLNTILHTSTEIQLNTIAVCKKPASARECKFRNSTRLKIERDWRKLGRNFWDSFAWFDPHSPPAPDLGCCTSPSYWYGRLFQIIWNQNEKERKQWVDPRSEYCFSCTISHSQRQLDIVKNLVYWFSLFITYCISLLLSRMACYGIAWPRIHWASPRWQFVSLIRQLKCSSGSPQPGPLLDKQYTQEMLAHVGSIHVIWK